MQITMRKGNFDSSLNKRRDWWISARKAGKDSFFEAEIPKLRLEGAIVRIQHQPYIRKVTNNVIIRPNEKLARLRLEAPKDVGLKIDPDARRCLKGRYVQCEI
jgi:hypothetical protein